MRKKKGRTNQPIIWMIDPYETKSAHRGALAKFLKTLSQSLSETILPFSVVTPPGRNWPIPVERSTEEGMKKLGTRAVEDELHKLHLSNLAPPTVEIHNSASRRELVQDVLRFSRKQKAGFIAVNTRRLLSPFPFKVGGVAEALIGSSRLPVIAVSPQAKISQKIKNILFPTDLSPRAHSAFKKSLQLASRLNAQIHLLHLETLPHMPYSFIDVPNDSSSYWFVESEKKQFEKNQRIARRWCEEAKRAHVRCTYEDSIAPISVAKAILTGAKKRKADLIALVSYRDAHTGNLVGGTVRDVLSSTKTPVIEYHAA